MNVVVIEKNVIFKIYDHLLSEQYDLKHYCDWNSFFDNYQKEPKDKLLICEISEDLINSPELFKKIKSVTNHLKILVVSQNDSLTFIKSILDGWADEYLTKPFNNNELLVKVSYFKPSPASGGIIIDSSTMQATVNGNRSESLTANEYRILNILLSNPETGIGFEEISLKIWNNKNSSQKLHTLLSRLRCKIEPLGFGVTANCGSKVLLQRIEGQ